MEYVDLPNIIKNSSIFLFISIYQSPMRKVIMTQITSNTQSSYETCSINPLSHLLFI